ncbi:hypothetical protein ABPG74_016881 [Tetrahymena malaccensis]
MILLQIEQSNSQFIIYIKEKTKYKISISNLSEISQLLPRQTVMLSNFIKSFDIFSQPIQFNSSKQTFRKRTFVGAFLSLCIIGVSITYFLYLTYLYLGNQVEPKFRSQSFITDEDIDIPLSNDYFAFQFKEYRGAGNLDTLQAKTNQTYIVFMAFYQYTNSSGFFQINLDIQPCQNPKLTGYNCLDYSKIPDQKITTGNMNNIFSQVTILAYKCQDIDVYKSQIPNNCASPQDIDSYIANLNNLLSIKLYTSQFNTTSQQMQINYKHQYAYMSIKSVQIVEFKAQKQISTINQGPLVQQQSHYSSPITFTVNTQALDLQTVQQSGFKMFLQILFDVDENVQYIDIQYPTYPEILAQINSAIAIMMGLGVLARYLAQNLVKQELFILILKTFYQQTFFKMLQLNNIDQFSDIFQLDYLLNNQKFKDEEEQYPVQVPQLLTKSCFNKLSLFTQEVNTVEDSKKDEILEQPRNEMKYQLQEFERKQNSISDRSDFQKSESIELASIQHNFQQQQKIKNVFNKNKDTFRLSVSNSPNSANMETKLNQDLNFQTLQDQQNKLINKFQSIDQGLEKRNEAKLNTNTSKQLEKILFKIKQYSSPISYTVNGQAIDLQTAKQQGFSMFMQILFEVDEAVEYIDIQYPTYPEILAQINSALAILMGLGVLARYMAQNLIKQELFILILKAFYQQTFFKILQLNKIENFEEIFQLDYQITDRKIITDEGQDPVCVPQLHTKSCFQKLRLQSQDLRNSTNDEKDEVLESLRISQQPYLLESNSNQNSLSNKFDFSKNQSDRLKSVRSTFKQQEEGKKLNLQTNTKRSSESIKFSQNISPPISAKSETKSIKGFILQNLDENQNKLFKQNQSTENIYKKRHITQLSENVSKELQNILFKTKLFQKSQYLESIGINMTASDCIFRQVNKSLDFLSFYSEVLLLKKAIMMILSEDQFAALQMVGASDDYIKVDNNEGLYTLNDNSNKLINHFEQQLCVQNSSQMQIKQMKKFLERYQENQNLTDIDRRIFSSIV